MHIKIIIPILTLATLICGQVHAVPQKYNKCSNPIVEPKNSSGYFMSEDCKIAYVLPPRIGRMTVSQYRPTGVIESRCSAIQSLEVENAYHHSLTSILVGEAAAGAEEIVRKKEQINSGLFPVGKTRKDIIAEIKELLAAAKEVRVEVLDFKRYYVESMQPHAVREGGVGSFTVENTYNELLDNFRDLNEGDVSFRNLKIDQNLLSVMDKSYDSDVQKTEMSAVLDLLVPGQSLPMSKGIANLLAEADVEVAENDAKKSIFGGALSGSIRMSDIGACIADNVLGFTSNFNIGDLKAYVSPNAFYEYQVQVERKYSVSYKLSELFKRIQTQTKRGGLFSRKTLTKLIDERRTSSWITFHSESQDVRFEYTDEDIREIKKQFLDRALQQIIVAKTGNTAAALTLIDPSGKNGADTIGDELQKCPHLYCQIGAAGFKVLSSIFGSEKATSELIQQFEGESHETVTSKKMVRQYGSMTFN